MHTLEECSVCPNYFTSSSVSQASKPWRYETTTTDFFIFFKQEATRKDGRLQNVVKKESSPLQRQQDFDQEILISEHVRTQTNSEPRAAILLGILPFTYL